jgi:Holliday junction resolvase-like predicted endonuclease
VWDEKLSDNERLQIEEAYSKFNVDALYDKGWDIIENKLYFMGEIEIIPHNKNTL